MSATVSQAPALHFHDVEAAVPTAAAATPAAVGTDQRPQEQEYHATAPAVVEIEAEADAGAGAGTGSSAAREAPRNGTTSLSFASLIVVGVVGMLATIFILGDIMNRRRLNPITTFIFLLSLSYCVKIWRRGRANLDDQEGTAAAAASRQPNVLTREEREALLTYFTFAHPTTAAAAVDVAEGKAGQSQSMQDRQQELQGKGLPSDADILDSSNGSRRWRWNRSTGSGRDSDILDGSNGSRRWRWDRSTGSGREIGRANGTSGGGGGGGGRQDDRTDTGTNTDTDMTPVITPIASPVPATPGPSEQQPHPHGGDADEESTAGATAVVARAGRGLLEDEEDEEGGGRGRRVDGCERNQLSRRGSAPFDGRDPVVLPTTNRTTAANASTSTTGTSSFNAEETPPTSSVKIATSPVAGDLTQSSSGAGAWSTDSACIVCFGDYEDGDRLCQLPCRHVYHAECINEWLDRAKRPSCPLCKTDLAPASTSTTQNDGAAGASGGTAAAAATGGAASGGGGNGGSGSSDGSDVQEVELTGDNAV